MLTVVSCFLWLAKCCGSLIGALTFCASTYCAVIRRCAEERRTESTHARVQSMSHVLVGALQVLVSCMCKASWLQATATAKLNTKDRCRSTAIYGSGSAVNCSRSAAQSHAAAPGRASAHQLTPLPVPQSSAKAFNSTSAFVSHFGT